MGDPQHADDPMSGRQVSHYRIERRLGIGGMGVIYLARHAVLNHPVAIKFLSPDLLESPDYIQRFLQEARAAAQLKHPNIVAATDAGSEDGVYYFVMEYVEGTNLSELLYEGKIFSEQEIVQYALKITSAMSHAHQQGIIHRDIKPENLILTVNQDIKVADLGLAKQLHQHDSAETISGTIMGTPFYISPEQIRDSSKVDVRTDIYSLGATLYHIATRKTPYKGSSSLEIISKHLSESVPKFPPDLGFSEGFCHVIYKMMAKEVEDRYQTMDDVSRAFTRLPESSKPAIPVKPPEPGSKRILRVPQVPSSGSRARTGTKVFKPVSIFDAPKEEEKKPEKTEIFPPKRDELKASTVGIALEKRSGKKEYGDSLKASALKGPTLKIKNAERAAEIARIPILIRYKKPLLQGIILLLVLGALYFIHPWILKLKESSSAPKVVSKETFGIKDATIQQKVEKILLKAYSKNPPAQTQGTAIFNLTLNDAGDVQDLILKESQPLSSDPETQKTFPPMKTLMEKAVRDSFPLDQEPPSPAKKWNGTLKLTAKLRLEPFERPLNVSEKKDLEVLTAEILALSQKKSASERDMEKIKKSITEQPENSENLARNLKEKELVYAEQSAKMKELLQKKDSYSTGTVKDNKAYQEFVVEAAAGNP